MSFDAALAFVLQWEGVLENVAGDPGGATNLGVTQDAYDRWRKGRREPSLPVALMDASMVPVFYRDEYWEPVCAGLPDRLAFAAFDSAVNCGVGRTHGWLMTCGWPGASEAAALSCLLGTRTAYYRTLAQEHPVLRKFLPGWLNRVAALTKEVA